MDTGSDTNRMVKLAWTKQAVTLNGLRTSTKLLI